jgi:neutral ceramidase
MNFLFHLSLLILVGIGCSEIVGWTKPIKKMTISKNYQTNTLKSDKFRPSSSTKTSSPKWKDDSVYRIGVGIGDITGPAAEVNMMGYAKFGQDTQGIHFRLFARTFIIEDSSGNRVVFISCDLGMIDQAVKTQVATTLSKVYGPEVYHNDNILISGTHTHSGPGGFLQYLLYTIVSQGFTKKTFDAIVDGVVKSVERAHSNMTPGKIYYNEGILLDANINRSPTAYLNNSEAERSLYNHDTDKEMYLLKFVDTNNKPLGMINWFPVHPTSMNNTNTLISGDNKGYASLLFERDLNGRDSLPGKGPFVAAFSNANLGDVSPNLNGPRCMDTGLPCDGTTSTCNGKTELCIATGPGKDMWESTEIIARRQSKKARELFDSAVDVVSGPVSFVHQHLDMSKQIFTSPITGCNVRTCKPAMGYSFAAGTTDGKLDWSL